MPPHNQSSLPRVVEFFFVGPGKTGTSWLYQFIRSHELASVPTLKEPHVVDRPPAEANQLVEQLYSSSDRLCDFSNTYSGDPDNPAKILAYNPAAKVIVTTRMPSKRIASHYAFSIRNGNRDVGLATYLASGDELAMLSRSDYRAILNRYVEAFGRDRVLLLPLEQLSGDPQTYVDRLTDFLGTNRVLVTQEDQTPVLARAAARSRPIARIATRIGKWLRRRGFDRTLGTLKRSRLIAKGLYKTDSGPAAAPDFGAAATTIQRLDDDYRLLLAEWLDLNESGGSR